MSKQNHALLLTCDTSTFHKSKLTVSLLKSKSRRILKKFFPCCLRPRTNFFWM